MMRPSLRSLCKGACPSEAGIHSSCLRSLLFLPYAMNCEISNGRILIFTKDFTFFDLEFKIKEKAQEVFYILNKLTDMYAGDRNAYIDSFNRYQLMIIDDLGIERNSEFAREQVFSVIDSRYRSQLPMIVTTNLTVDELMDPADLARGRIYSRVLERCLPIRVSDQNIRDLNQAAVFDRATQLLGGA